MKCLVTGSTGFIGERLTQELLRQGYEVNVLVRSDSHKAKFDNQDISFFKGDLFNIEAIDKAMQGCDFVFHLAAYANLWSKDKTLAHKTNVIGTRNILDAALKNRVKKVVFTSSAGTLPHSVDMEEVDESFALPENYLTEYESTKKEAELLCIEYFKKGLEIVIVNPTRVFGPGILNKSNSVTILIRNYLKGTWRFIPGDGSQTGNYVYIDDVINGHIAALKYGVAGEKYILGGTNISFNDFFELLAKVSGESHKLYHIPISLLLTVSKYELFMAETFGKKPLITPTWVKRYLQNRLVSGKKTIEALNLTITPLDKGLEKTIDWLKENYINRQL